MRLSPKLFFDYYITDPLSKELSIPLRVIALALSIILAVPTLGIPHLRSYYLRHRNVKNLKQIINKKHKEWVITALKTNRVSFLEKTKGVSLDLSPKDVRKIVNRDFLPFYQKKLPEKEKVTVPIKNSATGKVEWREWNTLSREEKILVNNTGTRAHNQLSLNTPELIADRHFFAHGQAPFLKGDPRESHGNDHCVRASIFAAIAAYLYQKYHPIYNVSLKDVSFCQLLAAGHDSGRQTEGPDVYDGVSAENTKKILSELGETNPEILKKAHEAIEEKDSEDFNKKSFYAKCVQMADCMEFPRLLLRSPVQDKPGFENSRNYLDIFRELKQIAEANNPGSPNAFVLKNGLTFGQFLEELDILRTEMNEFIYETHQRAFRENAVSSADYFQTFLNFIGPSQFPALNEILTQLGVKSEISIESSKRESIIKTIRGWQTYGFEQISSDSLEKFKNQLGKFNLKEKDKKNLEEINRILDLRKRTEADFLKVVNSNSPNLENLFTAYASLPLILKREHKARLLAILKNKDDNWLMQKVEEAEGTSKALYASIFCEKLSVPIRDYIENLDYKPSDIKVAEELENLCGQAFHYFQIATGDATKGSSLNSDIRTTLALGFFHASKIFLDNNENEKGSLALKKTEEINLGLESKFADPKKTLSEIKRDTYLYLPSDCNLIRKRKIRACKKIIDNSELYEMSMELTSNARKEIEKFLKLIPQENKKLIPAIFEKREGDRYTSKNNAEIGRDIEITLDGGIKILIGADSSYWNQHHLLRIRADVSVSSDQIHRALCKIGLPMVFHSSREEDVRNELLARVIAFRFPGKYFENPTNKSSAKIVFNNLSQEEKSQIEKDIQNARLTQVNHGHYEYVIPEIASEAWKNGIRSLGSFIWAGAGVVNTANVLKKILKNGLFSSQERFQNGILGLGCVPKLNYQLGSGNQVFTRILNEKLFKDRLPLSKFAVSGPILILIDTKALERLPYSYLHDRGGARNPHFTMDQFRAQKQKTINKFKALHAIKSERFDLPNMSQKLRKEKLPLNETMFDLNIGAKYIRRLIVWSEQDKMLLINSLEKEGFYEINGEPLEKVIVASKELSPEMVDNYYTSNPYEGDKDGIEYI